MVPSMMLTRARPHRAATANGVTMIGYTDLTSRLPSTATSLFGNNVAKFVLSVGPQTGGAKGEWRVDYADDAGASESERTSTNRCSGMHPCTHATNPCVCLARPDPG